jgi:hypothetical protein
METEIPAAKTPYQRQRSPDSSARKAARLFIICAASSPAVIHGQRSDEHSSPRVEIRRNTLLISINCIKIAGLNSGRQATSEA